MGEPKEKQPPTLRVPKAKKLGLKVRELPDIGDPHAALIRPEVTPVTTPVITPAITPASTPVTTSTAEPIERQQTQYLDATHTPSEAQVYSVMYRETISKNLHERHFGPAELMKKTGIRSDRTIRRAIDGLIAKLSIEITSYAEGNPLGPRYRIYKPKDIEQRRKAAGIEIDQFTKKIATPVDTPVTTPVATGDKNYRGTAVANTPVTGVENAGVFKYINDHLADSDSAAASSSNPVAHDDEAFADLLAKLQAANREATGRVATAAERVRWSELADLLIAEFKIAAARTGSVSSVPAFLTEHLRRRLWKKDKAQLEAESREAAQELADAPADASGCPDCGGSGWFYPEGPERGVTRCKHARLKGAT
ncbi:MAG: hypothetical protein ICV68_03635 [Pyrinomonadaceae bacterium]|nr:hypothetical protein [Pyrinomonadaceae bacterium]